LHSALSRWLVRRFSNLLPQALMGESPVIPIELGAILYWLLGCTGSLAYLFSNKPFTSDESHGTENERQDLQVVET
jgi:hypothetical protein